MSSRSALAMCGVVQDEAADALRQQGRDQRLLVLEPMAAVGDHQMQAVGAQHVGDRLDHGGVERVADRRHDQADDVGALGGQAAGDAVGQVAELAHRRLDPAAHLLRHAGGLAQRARHGHGRDAGMAGDVAHLDLAVAAAPGPARPSPARHAMVSIPQRTGGTTMSDRLLGFVGVGRMGGPMASRLLDAGYRLCVYDVSEEATRPLVARGARARRLAGRGRLDGRDRADEPAHARRGPRGGTGRQWRADQRLDSAHRDRSVDHRPRHGDRGRGPARRAAASAGSTPR